MRILGSGSEIPSVLIDWEQFTVYIVGYVSS
jgi:hypothetical protein